MNLNDIGRESLETSAAKGFGTVTADDWKSPAENTSLSTNEYAVAMNSFRYKIPTKLCLIHSEVSEALEEFRKEHRLDKFGGELADIIIRTAQLAIGLGIDLDGAVAAKLTANREREFQHGGRLI